MNSTLTSTSTMTSSLSRSEGLSFRLPSPTRTTLAALDRSCTARSRNRSARPRTHTIRTTWRSRREMRGLGTIRKTLKTSTCPMEPAGGNQMLLKALMAGCPTTRQILVAHKMLRNARHTWPLKETTKASLARTGDCEAEHR